MLSVVVATYNRRELLLNLLTGLASQDLAKDKFDVVIVDDGSRVPVRPAVEAQDWPFKYRILEQENAGQAAARHAGLELAAASDVVTIVDDDMTVPTHFLRAHLAYHERGYRVVLGHIRPAPELRTRPLFERFHTAQIERFVADMRRPGVVPDGAKFFTGNVSLRPSDYFKAGGFDRSLAQSEDRDLGIRLELLSASFIFAEDAYTINGSDQTDLEGWLRRAYRYGIYDSRIAAKYPQLRYIDPWAFLEHANIAAQPLFALAVASPAVAHRLSRLAMSVSALVDTRGLEALALKGTTIAYGLEYFSGVRDEAGSLRRALGSCRRYFEKPASPPTAVTSNA
ncbi:MAG TPA: glycosyltransferase family 2 protein [Polyangiaceae bacterium]|nr:glycosyltransferase family 2 protein [Polyangiaceae bacterium]